MGVVYLHQVVGGWEAGGGGGGNSKLLLMWHVVNYQYGGSMRKRQLSLLKFLQL